MFLSLWQKLFFEKVLYKSPQDLLIILSHSSWLIVMLQPYIRLLNVYIYRENLLLSINKFSCIDMRIPLIIQIYNCLDPCKTPSKSFHLRHTRHVIMRHIIWIEANNVEHIFACRGGRKLLFTYHFYIGSCCVKRRPH